MKIPRILPLVRRFAKKMKPARARRLKEIQGQRASRPKKTEVITKPAPPSSASSTAVRRIVDHEAERQKGIINLKRMIGYKEGVRATNPREKKLNDWKEQVIRVVEMESANTTRAERKGKSTSGIVNPNNLDQLIKQGREADVPELALGQVVRLIHEIQGHQRHIKDRKESPH